MNRTHLKHLLPGMVIAVLVIAALVGMQRTSGGSSITRARLERSLPQTFANLYVQQAAILGHPGVTVSSLHAKAQCDKGGPKVADHGPGADWICLMYWKDPAVPLPDGSGKFELNVHSDDCYTAGGPSKFLGLLTIVDTKGHDVPNPVFEFDACFDPKGDNSPTGVHIKPPTPSPAQAASMGTAKPAR